MKKTIDEKLSDALDIEAEIIPLDQELILNDVKDVNKTDIKNDDYEYARQNLNKTSVYNFLKNEQGRCW